jgi:HlyD family secretion protein
VGTLERDRIELTAEANEPIVEIAVREGDRVSAGAVLVRLEERRLRAELDAARAERDRAGARLAELERGPREERVAEARAQLAAARSAAFAARRELDRVRELARRDVASAARLDDAEGMHAEAVARRDQARAALDALLHGTTAEELAQARNAVAAAEAARAATEVRFERLTVRAPSAGEIDALPFELGERPPAGAVVAVLLAEGAPYARVYVPAELRIRVQPGGRARVRIDGRAEPLEGRVRTVARDPAFTPYFALTEHDRSRLAYVAEIVLEGAEAARLPAGIPVEARFEPAGLATRRADGS